MKKRRPNLTDLDRVYDFIITGIAHDDAFSPHSEHNRGGKVSNFRQTGKILRLHSDGGVSFWSKQHFYHIYGLIVEKE